MKHALPLLRISLLVTCVMALAMTGCQTAEVTTSLTSQYAGNDMDSQMNFWHSLNDKKLISNDEAFHGVLLMHCGEDHAKNYDERVWRLTEDKLLSADFKGQENEAITRGQLAAVLARILDIKGGVMMRLFGPQPRYALKEMVALRIFPTSSSQQVLNGAQFIEIMGRAEDYQTNVNRKANAAVLDAQEKAADNSKSVDTSSDTDANQPADAAQ
ncbi:MAG: hypothetical protein ACF8OB_03770 [Phycisphaeraceae bacterium JB051]